MGSAWAWWFKNFGKKLAAEEEDEAPKEHCPDPASPGSLLVVQPPSGYPHQLLWDKTASRYRCVACWSSVTAEGKWNLARQPCLKPYGTGHVMYRLGNLVYCTRCMAYSGQRVQKLHGPCEGRPVKLNDRHKRLLNGRHPTSREWLGEPLPFDGRWSVFA